MSVSLIDFISAINEDFEMCFEEEFGDTGITKGQVVFISYIGYHPGCSPSELAENTNADSGYTARSIKKLVDAGIAEKERRESDKRAYMIRLTEMGMARFHECEEMQRRWEEKVTEDLDSDERQQLLQLLNKMGIF